MNKALDIGNITSLSGHDRSAGIVAAFPGHDADETYGIQLFVRDESGECTSRFERFRPFAWVNEALVADICEDYDPEITELSGKGALNRLLFFRDWKTLRAAVRKCGRGSGRGGAKNGVQHYFINDPVQQYLMYSGRTMFGGMHFEELCRMQVDIECVVSEGFEFCNPDRPGDRIVAIGCCCAGGDVEIISDKDESGMLRRFVQFVRDKDPDVIEGHNLFNFDMNYLCRRAKLLNVKFGIGRDGSEPAVRSSRFQAGERTVQYDRYDICGRNIIDTMFLAQLYDISFRSLGGFGLKSVARHFGLAAENRTYVDAADMARLYREEPEKLQAYLHDDVVETRRIADLLSRSYFAQVQILPYTYQDTAVRGNATKIDALLVREYLRQGYALPVPGEQRSFEGGYTDLFEEGVINNVHHCDVRSLYPSIMLASDIAPENDELGVFPGLLSVLRDFRLNARRAAMEARNAAEKAHYDALQASFKILINSFYGYLGFAQGHFCDFTAAAEVTRRGRELLTFMIDWLREHGARPIEIDTDGVYYVPPAFADDAEQQAFEAAFVEALPEGIEVEFDGCYKAMFSYKMKNYALLCEGGEMIIKGAALKSRGLELFQRRYLEEVLRLRLEGRDAELAAVTERYRQSIRNREWPVEMFSKTETLQDSPALYEKKRRDSGRSRSAAYELAVASGREYRAGDQVSYYVAGTRKSVAVHEAARLAADWDPENRDENIPYYLAKLDALSKKFVPEDRQPELF